MSITNFTDPVGFSISGLQNIALDSINGNPILSTINIAGQTAFLSWDNTTNTLTLFIPTSDGVVSLGLLSSTDWNTFNNKENGLTFSTPLTRGGIGGNTISFDFSTVNFWTGVNHFNNAVFMTGYLNHTGDGVKLSIGNFVGADFSITDNITGNDIVKVENDGTKIDIFNYLRTGGKFRIINALTAIDFMELDFDLARTLFNTDMLFRGVSTTCENTFIVENRINTLDPMKIHRNILLFPNEYLFFTNTGSLGFNPGGWYINRFGQFNGSSVIVNDFIQATNNIETTNGNLGGLGLNIQGNQIFFQSPIPTTNNFSTLTFNTGSKQVGYSPSLLGTTNTFSATNFFTGDVVIGNNGRLSVNKGDGIASTVGAFTVCYEGYAPTWNVSAWTDRFALFSHGNGVGRVEATSSALGICQLSATENYIVSLRPNVAWMNTTIAGADFSIKYTSNSVNTCTFSNFITTWYEPNGDTMSYLVRNGVTSLKWVVFRTPTSYAYYDTIANVVSTTSDARTKKNIRPIDIEKSKQFILSITPSIFQHKDGDVTDTNIIGFIAQDILLNAKTEAQKNIVANWRPYEEAMAKQEEPKDILGVSSTLIIPELVGTIQLLNKKIEMLEEKIAKICLKHF